MKLRAKLIDALCFGAIVIVIALAIAAFVAHCTRKHAARVLVQDTRMVTGIYW